MRPWCGPADGSLPTAPQATYVNYPIQGGNSSELEVVMQDPQVLSNGDTRLIFGTKLSSNGTLPDFCCRK